LVLLLRSKRHGELEALGWSLLLFAVLGPVVEPWYETWGCVVLAVVAERWTLRIVLGLSALACFAQLPPARFFGASDPVVTVICWTMLVAAVGVYVATRLVTSFPRLEMPAFSRESARLRSKS
jgi:hypothetical protein